MQHGSIVVDVSLDIERRFGELVKGLSQWRLVDVMKSSSLLAECARADIVLVGERDCNGYWTSDMIGQIRSVNIGAALFLVAGEHRNPANLCRQLTEAGVDRCFSPASISLLQLAAAIRKRSCLAAPERVLRRIETAGDRSATRLLNWLLRNSYWRPSVEDAADCFGVTSRTVTRMLKAFGAPSFAAARGFGLVAHLFELQARYGLTRSQAARRLAFADAAAVSRLISRWSCQSSSSMASPWDLLCNLPQLYPVRPTVRHRSVHTWTPNV